MLGNTRFSIQPEKIVFESQADPPPITAEARLDDQVVTARLSLLDRLPLVRVELSAPGMQQRDLWAGLFFEKPYSDLQPDQQVQIDTAIEAGNPDVPDPVEF